MLNCQYIESVYPTFCLVLDLMRKGEISQFNSQKFHRTPSSYHSTIPKQTSPTPISHNMIYTLRPSLSLPFITSTFLLPTSTLQIPLPHHQPAPPTLRTPITLSTANSTCQRGGHLTWPLANTSQIIHRSALIYCQPHDLGFPLPTRRPLDSTVHKQHLGRCSFLGSGYSIVHAGEEGLAYLLHQEWRCEGLEEVKKGGSLCEVYLGVEEDWD